MAAAGSAAAVVCVVVASEGAAAAVSPDSDAAEHPAAAGGVADAAVALTSFDDDPDDDEIVCGADTVDSAVVAVGATTVGASTVVVGDAEPTVAVAAAGVAVAVAPEAEVSDELEAAEAVSPEPADVSPTMKSCGWLDVSRAGIAGTESVSPGAATSDVGTDGAAASGFAGVGAGALVIAMGAPIESETTGAFANGSFAFVAADDLVCGAVCEWESLTTGSFRTTRFVRAVAGTGSERCDAVALAGRGALGSGASWCTLGTRRSGRGVFGNVNAGSASFAFGIAGWRSAPAIGTTYRDRSTTRPIPAHQYRIPRKRIAVIPHGCEAATDA